MRKFKRFRRGKKFRNLRKFNKNKRTKGINRPMLTRGGTIL